MKEIMKRSYVFLIFILLQGCSAKGNSLINETLEEVITLNVVHQWNDLGEGLFDVYTEVVEQYEKQNPHIKINTEIVNMEAYKTKIQIEFAGGAEDIDLFYYWAESKPELFAAADKILPLNEYLTEETLTKIKPGALESFTYNNKIYSLPTFGWYLTWYCNRELFDLVGAKIPENFDELLVAVEKLKQLNGVIPIAIGARDAWEASLIYQSLVLSEVGASEISQMLNGETSFVEEGYLRAADRLIELSERKAFGLKPFLLGSVDADHIFLDGKAGMRLAGSWFAYQIDKEFQDNMVVAKIPIDDPDYKNNYIGGYVDAFYVNKNTEHKEEAVKFLIYLSESLGVKTHEAGLGYSGWKTKVDETKLKKPCKEIYQFISESDENVLAWDTVLHPTVATKHLSEVQSLFTTEADAHNFIDLHKKMLNK